MIDIKIIKAIAKGMLTYIPGVAYILDKKKRTSKHSGSNAEFCYTLWLSILVNFEENGIIPDFEKVGELGSGGSVGIGICALLTGSKQYFALEIEDHYDRENNLKLLDEIVSLFKNKTPISTHYNQLNIKISNYDYPSYLINQRFLDNKFIEELQTDINSCCVGSKHFNIIYDWHTKPSLNLDLVFSRAVMEHVNDPNQIYKRLAHNLKPGAFTFHDIEFHSHDITSNINGHLDITKGVWKIIFGERAYFLNRWTLQEHISALENLNYQIIQTRKSTEIDNNSPNEVLIGATVLAKLN
jgi:hypothetical protein